MTPAADHVPAGWERRPSRPPVRGPSGDRVRQRELGAFLRSRRERLDPAELGLPLHGRRRTPGLRREEVAQLAGVGVTWYTWLEQGRAAGASDQVLAAVAGTLLLDGHERAHLFALAAAEPYRPTEAPPVPAEVRAVLAQLDPFPAFVVDGRHDLVAYNRAYAVLVGDLDALPAPERNLLWLMFVKRTSSRAVDDGGQARAVMVAQLRAAMVDHLADPAWTGFVARLLAASTGFSELWQRYDVLRPEDTRKRVLHRELDLLCFTQTCGWLAGRTGLRMVTYVPSDAATRASLDRAARLQPLPIT